MFATGVSIGGRSAGASDPQTTRVLCYADHGIYLDVCGEFSGVASGVIKVREKRTGDMVYASGSCVALSGFPCTSPPFVVLPATGQPAKKEKKGGQTL